MEGQMSAISKYGFIAALAALAPVSAPGAETKTIQLGAAGTVTITVAVRWLDLPMERFSALRQAIQALEALDSSASGEEGDS